MHIYIYTYKYIYIYIGRWARSHPLSGQERAQLAYRGTSLTRKRSPLGPYRRPMPRVLGGSKWGGRFIVGEVPVCRTGRAPTQTEGYKENRVEIDQRSVTLSVGTPVCPCGIAYRGGCGLSTFVVFPKSPCTSLC